MNFTEHFTWAELTRTDTSLPNIPSDFEVDRLRRLASALEEIRAILGHPLTINSAFRSELVNRAVGGAEGSAHLRGDAADFTCAGYGSPRDICLAVIDAGIGFDQLILEPSWVHIGMSDRPRRQVLTMRGGRYTPGLAAE